MSILRFFLLLLLTVSIGGYTADAHAVGRALCPFDEISATNVSILLGNAIGDAPYKDLWTGIKERRAVFELELKKEVEGYLIRNGIAVRSGAEDFLSVGIWGHQQVLDSGSLIYVYFIELTVINYNWNPEAPCEDQRDFEQSSRAIGAANNNELERELKVEVLRLLREELSRRIK